MTPRLKTLDHLVLTVADINKTISFYCNILGMTHTPFVVAGGSTRHAVSFGRIKINLHQKGAKFEPKALHTQTGSADLCFLSATDLQEWLVHFARHLVPTESGPVPRTGATGPLMSIYLRDPDGNLIEVSTSL